MRRNGRPRLGFNRGGPESDLSSRGRAGFWPPIATQTANRADAPLVSCDHVAAARVAVSPPSGRSSARAPPPMRAQSRLAMRGTWSSGRPACCTDPYAGARPASGLPPVRSRARGSLGVLEPVHRRDVGVIQQLPASWRPFETCNALRSATQALSPEIPAIEEHDRDRHRDQGCQNPHTIVHGQV